MTAVTPQHARDALAEMLRERGLAEGGVDEALLLADAYAASVVPGKRAEPQPDAEAMRDALESIAATADLIFGEDAPPVNYLQLKAFAAAMGSDARKGLEAQQQDAPIVLNMGAEPAEPYVPDLIPERIVKAQPSTDAGLRARLEALLESWSAPPVSHPVTACARAVRHALDDNADPELRGLRQAALEDALRVLAADGRWLTCTDGGTLDIRQELLERIRYAGAVLESGISPQPRPSPELAAARSGAEQAREALGAVMAEHRQVRELLDEVGVMAANAPEDGDSFGLLEEIAMKIAAAGTPLEEP